MRVVRCFDPAFAATQLYTFRIPPIARMLPALVAEKDVRCTPQLLSQQLGLV